MVSYPPSHPRRIYGVDFSGAAKAGNKIWITSSVLEVDALRIEACHRAAELSDSGPDRDQCLAALRDFIGREAASAFGLDFPFGLPRDLLAPARPGFAARAVKSDTWEDFVLSFADRYASPEAFRKDCRTAVNGTELKRVTDRESHTPFSPYNIRLYRQTYFGIHDVLAPLVQDRLVCVLPMQRVIPGIPWVMEICPASTLKQENLNRPYKGRSKEHYEARARILEELVKRVPLSMPSSLRLAILDDCEGDALDSTLAAFAVFRALRDPGQLAVGSSDAYALEGYVYV